MLSICIWRWDVLLPLRLINYFDLPSLTTALSPSGKPKFYIYYGVSTNKSKSINSTLLVVLNMDGRRHLELVFW